MGEFFPLFLSPSPLPRQTGGSQDATICATLWHRPCADIKIKISDESFQYIRQHPHDNAIKILRGGYQQGHKMFRCCQSIYYIWPFVDKVPLARKASQLHKLQINLLAVNRLNLPQRQLLSCWQSMKIFCKKKISYAECKGLKFLKK